VGVFDDEFWFLREREGERERKRKKRYPHIFLPFISNHQAAIVTCGGLCPGLNDVVQSLTQKLAGGYGVKNIVGVRYGLKGFYDKTRKSVKLTPAAVEGIQLQGGTILGTSRGGADIAKIVQAISRQAIDMVFVVGRNGGNAAAAAIHDGTFCFDWFYLLKRRGPEVEKLTLSSSSSSLPPPAPANPSQKRNRVRQEEGHLRRHRRPQVDRQRHPAHRPLLRLRYRGRGGAACPARSEGGGLERVPRSGDRQADGQAVGLYRNAGVAVFGRRGRVPDPGGALLAGGEGCVVDFFFSFVFGLRFFYREKKLAFFKNHFLSKKKKTGGLIAHLTKLIERKGHAVVCVAEGAGQDLLSGAATAGGGAVNVERDASGNPILADVGPWLKSELKKGIPEADVKLIDPSYTIRSVAANSADRVLCKVLAHNAVHAAFAGYSGVTVGLVNTHYVYLPTPLLILAPRRVDPRSKAWNRLRSSLKQPSLLGDGDSEWEYEDEYGNKS